MNFGMNMNSEKDKFLRKVRPCAYLKYAAFPFSVKMNSGFGTDFENLTALILLCSSEKDKLHQTWIRDPSLQKIWNALRTLPVRGRSL